MANSDRTKRPDANPTGSNDRGTSAKNRDAHTEHRLRGAEFDDDFSDADQDSCTSTHPRNERESDS